MVLADGLGGETDLAAAKGRNKEEGVFVKSMMSNKSSKALPDAFLHGDSMGERDSL